MFKKMSIKQRLFLVLFTSIVGMLVVVFLSWQINQTQLRLATIKEKLAKIEVLILQERRNEKDFLTRKKTKYIERFQNTMAKLEAEIASLKAALEESGIPTDEVVKLQNDVEMYKNKFNQIATQLEKIGFDEKSGLRGKLRDAVHKAEADVKKIHNSELLSDILMLRRNEKDFIIRHNEKYLAKHQKNYQKLIKRLDTLDIDKQAKKTILSSLKKYKNTFETFATVNKVVGLNEKLGMQGELRSAIHATDESLQAMLTTTNKILSQQYEEQKTIFFAVLFITIVLLAGFILYVVYSITKPLSRLSKEIGSNTNDLTKQYCYEREDELKVMVDAINRFSAKLNEAIHTSKLTSKENLSIAEELATAAHNIHESSQRSTAIVAQTTEQSTVAQEKMNETLQQTTQANEKMELTAETIEEVARNFSFLITNIQESADVENQLSEKLGELSNDAEQVKDILTIIGDIADQTNLLALNAAIEAARAGEHGRGFAVVADEVRKLAERTQKSLVEIQSSVNVIVQNILEASGQISINSKKFAELVESSNEVDEKISQSKDNISTTLQSVNQASALTQETAKQITQIMEQIKEINAISHSNSKSAEEVSSATDELLSLTEKLNKQLEYFITKS